MNVPSSLGQRIAQYRKKTGVSQKDLAAAVGITSTALNRYEKDKREPTVVILMKLAKRLNITGDELLGLERHPDMTAKNSDEYALLRNYRTLNDLGQTRLLEYSSGLTEMRKFLKL